MTWTLLSSGKSGKREVAISLLMFWAFISGYLFFWIPTAAFKEYADGWSTLTWATFAFAAGAFGIDFAIKSGLMGGGRAQVQPPAAGAPRATAPVSRREID